MVPEYTDSFAVRIFRFLPGTRDQRSSIHSAARFDYTTELALRLLDEREANSA